jgi:YggT family protein
MLHAIFGFIAFIIGGLLEVAIWVVVAYAVLSWLIAFNVVNLRNRTVWQIANGLERIVTPVLRPIRRVLPTVGGMDFSPLLLLLVLAGLQRILLPAFIALLYATTPSLGPVS